MDQNSKRIIKNTGFLYLRMILLMCINIYASRVILDNLGIEDYGIYNVVGGLTSMFAFFQSSLANATQRFLSVELGKGSKEGAKKVYSHFFFIYLIFVIIVLIALETIGYWFVVNKLNIPIERLDAAVKVFHMTVISLCFTLIGTVFNSAIIAHEDMSYYSYVGVFEGIMKLIIAYAIVISGFDRLVTYAFLLMLVVVGVQVSYAVRCFVKYEESNIIWYFERSTIVQMGKFFSWNFLGTIIYMTKDQFVNILINIFFGPAINAARGISFQLNSVLSNFSSSIFTSVQPQIVKSFAVRKIDYLHKLVFFSSKYSVIFFWIMALPVILNVDFLLSIWLKKVPEFTGIFTIWILVDSLLVQLTNAPWGVALASGQLRKYTIYGNGVLLLVFPLSYLALSLGASAVSVFIITAFVRALQVVLVVNESNKLSSFGLLNYLKEVILPIVKVIILSTPIPFLVSSLIVNEVISFFVSGIISVLFTGLAIWVVGLNKMERQYVLQFVKSKINNEVN